MDGMDYNVRIFALTKWTANYWKKNWLFEFIALSHYYLAQRMTQKIIACLSMIRGELDFTKSV